MLYSACYIIQKQMSTDLDRTCVWPWPAGMTGSHHRDFCHRPQSQRADRPLLVAYCQSPALLETCRPLSQQPTIHYDH